MFFNYSCRFVADFAVQVSHDDQYFIRLDNFDCLFYLVVELFYLFISVILCWSIDLYYRYAERFSIWGWPEAHKRSRYMVFHDESYSVSVFFVISWKHYCISIFPNLAIIRPIHFSYSHNVYTHWLHLLYYIVEFTFFDTWF